MPLEEEDEPPEGEDKPKVLSASLLNVILGASMKIVKKLLIDSILFFFLILFYANSYNHRKRNQRRILWWWRSPRTTPTLRHSTEFRYLKCKSIERTWNVQNLSKVYFILRNMVCSILKISAITVQEHAKVNKKVKKTSPNRICNSLCLPTGKIRIRWRR